MTDGYTYETYDMARYYIAEGMYSIEEVKRLLGHMEAAKDAQDKYLKQTILAQTDHVPDVRKMVANRTWVGLTDEERADCWNSSAVQFAINIEAKFKQKNGYAEEKNT